MTKKVAAVTGSRRGIGLGIVKKLLQEGYQVVMSATGTYEEALPVLENLQKEYPDVDYIKCNIAEEEDQVKFFAQIRERYGRLDLLVNNAGVAPNVRLDILETTRESVERLLSINLEGTFFMCQKGAKEMIAFQQEGLEEYQPRIVNICSISAYTSSVNRGEYCMSKAGLAMVTQLFADRLSEYGIPVFEVRPGIIETDMTSKVKDKYEAMIAGGLTPIQRMGQPADVANCVYAAASGLLDFATGQVLNADGGFHIRRL